MKKTALGGAALVVALALTGCGGEDEGAGADPYAPNTGERALAVGDSRRSEFVETALLEVKQYPSSPELGRSPSAGMGWIGLRVKQCVSDDAVGTDAEPFIGAGSMDFAAVDGDDGSYPGGSSTWNDFPAPRFPDLMEMRAGDCAQGWMLLELPTDAIEAAEKIVYRPTGHGTLAEWSLDGELDEAPPPAVTDVTVTLIDDGGLDVLFNADGGECTSRNLAEMIDQALDAGGEVPEPAPVLVRLVDQAGATVAAEELPARGGRFAQATCTWPVTFSDVPIGMSYTASLTVEGVEAGFGFAEYTEHETNIEVRL